MKAIKVCHKNTILQLPFFHLINGHFSLESLECQRCLVLTIMLSVPNMEDFKNQLGSLLAFRKAYKLAASLRITKNFDFGMFNKDCMQPYGMNTLVLILK